MIALQRPWEDDAVLDGNAQIAVICRRRGSGRVDPIAAASNLPAWTHGLPGTIISIEPYAGTTMNVAQWLNAIDLGQYEALFREHEIDAGVLRDLVEADLEKIGVPLGHRKRLLKAIAALGTGETAVKPPSPAPVLSPATAERRPITVMFCDLVGSTSLAAKLDAEIGAHLSTPISTRLRRR